MKGKELYTHNALLDLLDQAGLTEEIAERSEKVYMMRMIIIDRYMHYMSREEICAQLSNISLGTFDRLLDIALDKIYKVLK